MKISSLYLLLIFVFSNVIYSQDKSKENLLNTFFNKYEKSPVTALTYIYSTNYVLYEKNKQDIDKFITEFQTNSTSIWGNYYGYQKLRTEEVFYDSLIKYQYVLNYDNIPLLFEITLYKPKDEWMLYNFVYITNFGLPEIKKQ